MKTNFAILWFILVIVITLGSCRRPRELRHDNYKERNVLQLGFIQELQLPIEDRDYLELPRSINNRPEQILHRLGYFASYNNETKNANWVAWYLTKEHIEGLATRKGIPYYVDTCVVGGRQELEDWQDVPDGYDHGHLCPAGDNKWDTLAMMQTFLLTNMCPQNSALNRGDWQKLEERCRGWAKHYGGVYIAAGPIFYSPDYKTMGENNVGIPDAFFKVVLCMNKRPKALGFIYPNNGKHHKLEYYVRTVDEIENLTGFDFFYLLPDSIEDEIEAEANLEYW